MLTAQQKEMNSETWRHIWNVQRLLVSAEQNLIKRSLNTNFFHKFQRSDELPDFIQLVVQCASGLKTYEGLERTHEQIMLGINKSFVLDQDIDLVYDINQNTLQLMVGWISNNDCELVLANQFPYLIYHCAKVLTDRCITHDQSKLAPPEVDTFCKYTPMLKEMEFGSDEYKQCLSEMKPALDNHYAHNRHHPEHYENGIRGMTWLDCIEMSADWSASSLRTKNGSFSRSVEICKERFQFGNFFAQLITNTYLSCFSDVIELPEEHYLKQGI